MVAFRIENKPDIVQLNLVEQDYIETVPLRGFD